MSGGRHILWCMLAGLAMVLGAPAQDAERDGAAAQKTLAEKNAETLSDLFEAMREVEGQIAAKRQELEEATVDELKRELEEDLAGLKSRLDGVRADFEKLATGVDKNQFDDQASEVIDLKEEFKELLRPVVGELKEATSTPRELEQMRGTVEVLKQRRQHASRAVKRLVPLRELAEGSALETELAALQAEWEGRLSEADSQLQALDLRIAERLAEQESVWTVLSRGVAEFCRTRGRNLLFAAAAFIATLLLMKKLMRAVQRYGPLHRKEKASFMVRLIDVTFEFVSIVSATAVSFGVLYATGDWLLLTIGVFFVLGLAWAAKNTLPAVYEQVKLVLNLGPVREGERFMAEGVPWRVESLGFYCEFSNPELTKGVLRLPLRELIDKHSRPYHEKERWFPTSLNDWVLLGDGAYGKVIDQTPEQVVLLKIGGSRTTYTTEAFLGLNPENLSSNFRVAVTFGIDYAHQQEVTGRVLDVFKQRIEADLMEYAGEDGLVSLNVEFKEAGPSSLDFVVLADMAGSMGSRYNYLQRRIQRICVDVCNEQGYGIPFTQITLHQAGE